MKMIKLICLMVLFLTSGVTIDAQNPSSDELDKTVNKFFNAWLVRRNINQALNFLSPNAILTSCMMTKNLKKKKLISQQETRNVFRIVLAATLKYSSEKVKKLDEIINSQGTDLFEMDSIMPVKHRSEELFKIFTLKPIKNSLDIAYVCKFDERRSFRDKVSKPDVHYVIAGLQSQNNSPSVAVLILWVREKTSWKILTIDFLTNED